MQSHWIGPEAGEESRSGHVVDYIRCPIDRTGQPGNQRQMFLTSGSQPSVGHAVSCIAEAEVRPAFAISSPCPFPSQRHTTDESLSESASRAAAGAVARNLKSLGTVCVFCGRCARFTFNVDAIVSFVVPTLQCCPTLFLQRIKKTE